MNTDTGSTAPATLTSRELSGQTVIEISGELDVAVTPTLRENLIIVLGGATGRVVLDLSGLTFCDAAGLALLIGTRHRARRHGLTVVLAAPRPQMSKLLHITGLHRVFEVHETLTDALHPKTPADDAAAVA